MVPPAEELRRLWVEERWSPEDIAAHYSRHRATVYRWLRDLDIRRPRDSWALTISPERLRALYDEPLTLEQIAEREQVTLNQVYKAMQHHQIERRRPTSQTPSKPLGKAPPPPDELRRLLQETGSVKGVANALVVGVSTAHRWLSKADISPLRAPGQRRSTSRTSPSPRTDGGCDRANPARTTSVPAEESGGRLP